MPTVNQVRPKIWNNVIDLYDDGDYSAIWGNRERDDQRSLGVHWNGSETYPGYPNQGKIQFGLVNQISWNDLFLWLF